MARTLVHFRWWPPAVRPDPSSDAHWNALIHKDDLQDVLQQKLSCGIFEHLGTSEGYELIRQINLHWRVKQECLKFIEDEGFYLGDNVQVKSLNGKNTVKLGTISNMVYNYKHAVLEYYLTDRSGKKIKKKYIREDLKTLKNHPPDASSDTINTD